MPVAEEFGGVVDDIELDRELKFGVDGRVSHDRKAGVAKEFTHMVAIWTEHSLEVFDWCNGTKFEV